MFSVTFLGGPLVGAKEMDDGVQNAASSLRYGDLLVAASSSRTAWREDGSSRILIAVCCARNASVVGVLSDCDDGACSLQCRVCPSHHSCRAGH